MACIGLVNKHILKQVGISPSDPFALFFLSELRVGWICGARRIYTFISGSCLSVSGHIPWPSKAKWLTITHGCACYWYLMAWSHHSCLKATSLAAILNVSRPFWFTRCWMADDCQLTTTNNCQWLWSSNIATCEVPRSCPSLGDQSFATAGPHVWHNPPLHLRDCGLWLVWTTSLAQPTSPPTWLWTLTGCWRCICFAEDHSA